MGRPPARARLARPAHVALLAAALAAVLVIGVSVGVSPASAKSGWGNPIRFAAPVSSDIRAPLASLSPAGVAAVSYAVGDDDAPSTFTADAAWRRSGGGVSRPYSVPAGKQVLAQTFQGGTLQLLTGGSETTNACCSSVGVIGMQAGGRFARMQPLVSGLAGATAGQLVTFGRRTLAAIATERGVWVSESNTSARFGKAKRLAGAGSAPQSLAAAALQKGGGVVAWSGGKTSVIGPRSIFLATGSTTQAPGGSRKILTVPGTDGIDELGVAATKGGATLAWIDSWYDTKGNYRSKAAVADAAHMNKVTSLQVPGVMASGLSIGADSRGDQVLSWKTCSWSGTCAVQVAVRTAGKAFGTPFRLGAIDATDVPDSAVAPGGQALVGWVSGGHPTASYLQPKSTRFGPAVRVSTTTFAADLTLAFRASGEAIAVWSQGTFTPEVVGALFSPR